MDVPHTRPTVQNPKNNVQRIIIFTIGTIVNGIVFNYGWDYVLYPYVIWLLGPVVGGITMLIASTLICVGLIFFYDWSKQDWLGIETLKELRDVEAKGNIRRYISSLMKKSDGLALVILSVQFDPFITTVYMRHGSHQYNGMGKRDWQVFIASTLIANLYWIFIATLAVQAISWIIQTVSAIL